ncbi:cytochrome c554/c'-like protein, partial [Nitrosomonas nitrosa]
MKNITAYALAVVAMFAFTIGNAVASAPFEGRSKCSSCHKAQAKSWKDTAHAKAMESLKPGTRKEAKIKANLDPDKDYTQDKDCVGCHVDGWGKPGGYTLDSPKKQLAAVGCESCHGPGRQYRGDHRKAGQAFEKSGKTAPRKMLADKGQDFHFEESCNACHLNYEGSPWKDAKPPYTPFTPEVDPKYTFDFDKMVKDVKAMHEHFKMDGVFVGEPKFKFHDEFQANAKVAEKDDKKGK